MITLDANLLLRLPNSADRLRAVSARAISMCKRRDTVVIFPQVLYEFWAVATRVNAENGLGMTPERAGQWIRFIRNTFTLLPDPPALADRWQMLVRDRRVTGLRVHDTRYVAAMECHGVTSLLTYNQTHFKEYNISVLDPASI